MEQLFFLRIFSFKKNVLLLLNKSNHIRLLFFQRAPYPETSHPTTPKYRCLSRRQNCTNSDFSRSSPPPLFMQVTKSKTWKDIAGLLGIGASSSAAYTLRKHYTKNLLAFECHFDRGGIDPLPIIQQVEAGSKKKTTKAASVPSPG